MLILVLLTMFSQALAAAKIVSLPISANFKSLERGSTLVDRDRTRIKALLTRTRHRKRTKGLGLNSISLSYTLRVGFGSPPTYYNLEVDTGSSLTWIGANNKYVRTETSVQQANQVFDIRYGTGSVFGTLYKDLVTLSPSLSVANMPFGAASRVDFDGDGSGFSEGMDGIVGLAPSLLNRDTSGEVVPNIIDALFAQKKIERNMFGLLLAPATSQGIMNGKLNLGGVDGRKYKGEINWVETTKAEPWNKHWAIDQTIKYGKQTIQPTSTGLVDSGTSLIYITPNAFKAYYSAIPGSKFDKRGKILEIPKDSIAEMKSLFFVLNGVSYELTPNAQLWPRALNAQIGGKEGVYYSAISSLDDDDINMGLDFVNGYAFLQRFYTAYDGTNSVIGFATTSATYASVN